MGGTSKATQVSQSQTQPWQQAQPALGGILSGVQGTSTSLTPNETGAFDTLSANANAGNPFTGQIGSLTGDLFSGGTDRTGMVNDAYSKYQKLINPTAAGQFLDPSTNPFFAQTTQTIGNDVWNRLSAQYAGSGRDPSGAGNFGYGVARGIAEGTAPTFANVYQGERANQLGAINGLNSAGMGAAGLLSGLDQTALGNRQAGVGAAQSFLGAQNYAPNQQLAIEAQKRGIPLSILQSLAGIATPIAGLGGQSSGTSSGTQQMSGAQQFAMLGQGAGGFGKLLFGA